MGSICWFTASQETPPWLLVWATQIPSCPNQSWLLMQLPLLKPCSLLFAILSESYIIHPRLSRSILLCVSYPPLYAINRDLAPIIALVGCLPLRGSGHSVLGSSTDQTWVTGFFYGLLFLPLPLVCEPSVEAWVALFVWDSINAVCSVQPLLSVLPAMLAIISRIMCCGN